MGHVWDLGGQGERAWLVPAAAQGAVRTRPSTDTLSSSGHEARKWANPGCPPGSLSWPYRPQSLPFIFQHGLFNLFNI